MAGSGAGATATICTYPLDYIRSRMAVQTHKHGGPPFESLPHAIRVSIAEHGAMSLFTGMWPTLIGIIPYAGTRCVFAGRVYVHTGGVCARGHGSAHAASRDDDCAHRCCLPLVIPLHATPQRAKAPWMMLTPSLRP